MTFLDQLDPQLRANVEAVVSQVPGSLEVFEQVYNAAKGGEDGSLPRKVPKTEPEEPKKEPEERVELDLDSMAVLKDISVTVPDRKKFAVAFDHTSFYLLRLDSWEVHTSVSFKDIKTVLFLRIPDKAKPQHNVVVVTNEPVVQFTVTDVSAEKVLRTPSPIEDKKDASIEDVVALLFKKAGVKVQRSPDLCVSAHRGSKEGLLFFLDEYVFFGFKKPLLLIPIGNIESVSYSSVIRVTFNLTIKLFEPLPGTNDIEYEFSMIDQGEYDRIDKYVVDNEFNNQSMSEQRRAKVSAKDIVSNEIRKVIEQDPNLAIDTSEGAEGTQQPADDDSDDEEDDNYEMSEDNSGSSDDEDEDEDEDGQGEEDDDDDEEDEDEDDDGDQAEEAEEAEDEE
uniref:Histone chaperone RTT106 n=1 Tax=Blastobotrys adeninivorans TaxID=409370 RepID=A0A060SXC6_BLAAD